jgi:hypothetical protein
MGDGRRERRDGLGQAWDRWIERVNGPSRPDPHARDYGDDEQDDDPLTLRDVLLTAAGFAIGVPFLLLLHSVVDFNWGWIPWKQLALLGLVVAVLARWITRAVRSLVRHARGRPPLERPPTERDKLVEKLRELDEPYMKRERTTVRD